MIKAQLHIHIQGDPVDKIKYTWRDLIDRAKKLDYRILAITCHKKIIFPPKALSYAKKHGILLIKGIEIEISKKHIIILNAHKDSEKIQTFHDLKKYKQNHKESLIVAAHPYFPTKKTLKKSLEKHIDLFDAIEYTFFYTKTKNYNKKAEEIAKKYNKPLIGVSDCHILKHLDSTYTLLDCGKDNSTPTIKTVFNAILQKKSEIVTTPLSHHKATGILLSMFFQN
jgi:predicted metal-dependent phosphoesterase TrpH